MGLSGLVLNIMLLCTIAASPRLATRLRAARRRGRAPAVRGLAGGGAVAAAEVAARAREELSGLEQKAKEVNKKAEMEVKRYEEWHDGVGFEKWRTCFDCGQEFHGAVELALGWASWKMYLGQPETNGYRCTSLGALGTALYSNGRSEEALPVLEAELALLPKPEREHLAALEQHHRVGGTGRDLHRLLAPQRLLQSDARLCARRVVEHLSSK